MSILLSARQRAGRPPAGQMASLGLTPEPGRLGTLLVWLLGLPLCLFLGMGANLGWHWWNNKPVEQQVAILEPTLLPYHPSRTQPEFVTEPLPVPPPEAMDEGLEVADAPGEPLPAPERPKVDLTGVSPELAQRFMQALATPAEPMAPARAEPSGPEAVPLASLPPALSRQVPALRYNSHVYSSVPANRSISLNGHLYREGDQVAPGLVLLQILPEASILRIGSQSFSLPALSDWAGG